jgi:hypothetical protein
MQTTKPAEVGLRTQFCRSICSFSEAVQDYVSNIEAMPDSSVTLGREIPAGSIEDPDPYNLGLADPDPLVRCPDPAPDLSIIKQK